MLSLSYKLWMILILTMAGNVVGEKSCSRLSEIIGDLLSFYRYDYNIAKVTEFRNSRDVERLAEEIKEYTRDKLDIWSEKDREDLVCEALSAKTFNDLWMLFDEEAILKERTNSTVLCYEYQRGITDEHVVRFLDEKKYQDLYDFGKDFTAWLDYSGFPNSFPIRGNHSEHVAALTKAREFVESDTRMWWHLFNQFLPVRPIYSSKWDPITNEYIDTAIYVDLDELVNWMEDSTSIFSYASHLKEHEQLGTYIYLWSVTSGKNMIELFRDSYDKALMVKEAVEIINNSNLFHIDTSDCEVQYSPDENYPFRY